MFDMDKFEIEYRRFILDLKRRKYGEEAVKKDMEELEKFEDETTKKQSINQKYQKIIQLRKDIAEGRVVKTPIGNGKFAWKRVPNCSLKT